MKMDPSGRLGWELSALPTAGAEQGYRGRVLLSVVASGEQNHGRRQICGSFPPETLPNTSMHRACLAPAHVFIHSILAPSTRSSCAGPSLLTFQHWLFLKNIMYLAQGCSPVQFSTAHILCTCWANSPLHVQSPSFLLHPPCKPTQLTHPSRTPSPWLRQSGAPAKAG